jgi:hypothetical protein
LPPAEGLFASGVAAFPPPHPTAEPTSIPATADTARAFAMFITLVSWLLLEERLALLQRLVRRLPPGFGATFAARLARYGTTEAFFFPEGGMPTYEPGTQVKSIRPCERRRETAWNDPTEAHSRQEDQRTLTEVASCRG